MIYTGLNALLWVGAVGLALGLLPCLFNLVYHIGADISEDLHKRAHRWKLRQAEYKRDMKEIERAQLED